MAKTTYAVAPQDDDNNQFELDMIDKANDQSNDLTALDENGHSQFYNLFNDTINFYGDKGEVK